MNKQEVIEKIEKEKINLNGWEDLTRNCALDDALDIVKQLDEPEKPVVPQFVTDWYKSHKDYFEWSLSHIGLDVMNGVFDDNPEMYDWLNNADNKPFETLVKMKLYGYEVEKEKLYTVSLKRNGIGMGVQQQDGSFKEQFTKAELSEYGFDNLDEYEVEEVEE
ncbi:DUF1642 domain-containing protein [Streptococcus lutetiensis]|uniref:DUF1642 domain-containing protein n=1 Tax=Streptococcus lutetiensis TaxID=150055 RepID=UPI001964070F|nr:DUF1642 domain-containing protein [Streptococcus lutetiensis]